MSASFGEKAEHAHVWNINQLWSSQRGDCQFKYPESIWYMRDWTFLLYYPKTVPGEIVLQTFERLGIRLWNLFLDTDSCKCRFQDIDAEFPKAVGGFTSSKNFNQNHCVHLQWGIDNASMGISQMCHSNQLLFRKQHKYLLAVSGTWRLKIEAEKWACWNLKLMS